MSRLAVNRLLAALLLPVILTRQHGEYTGYSHPPTWWVYQSSSPSDMVSRTVITTKNTVAVILTQQLGVHISHPHPATWCTYQSSSPSNLVCISVILTQQLGVHMSSSPSNLVCIWVILTQQLGVHISHHQATWWVYWLSSASHILGLSVILIKWRGEYTGYHQPATWWVCQSSSPSNLVSPTVIVTQQSVIATPRHMVSIPVILNPAMTRNQPSSTRHL
jgi:hypothetical protein